MIDQLLQLWEFVSQLGLHLETGIALYGAWTYLLLGLIIFAETGLVVTSMLPADSLLFVSGALAGRDALDLFFLLGLLTTAAILGDSFNYWLGSRIGVKAFDGRFRFLKPDHLARAHDFFAEHGGKAIAIARFVPMMRVLVPFVAGMGSMPYRRFLTFDIVGASLWVGVFVFGGYFFGGLPFVERNFSLVLMAVAAAAVLAFLLQFGRKKHNPTLET